MNKKQYIAPELTVVTFKAERGFADSIPVANFNVLNTFSIALGGGISASSQVETWDDGGNLFGTEGTW